MRFLILLITIIIAFNSSGQDIVFEDKALNLSQIPFNNSLYLKHSKDNSNTHKVYKSTDNKYIAIANIRIINNQSPEFTFLSDKGLILWEKKVTDYFVNDVHIDTKNQIVHTQWNSIDDDISIEKAFVYKAFKFDGSLLKELMGSFKPYFVDNSAAVYMLKNKGGFFYLTYDNIKSGKYWEKELNSKFKILAISNDGSKVIILQNRLIKMINDNGDILWEKNKIADYYQCSFSDDGKYFTQRNSYDSFKIINSSDGTEDPVLKDKNYTNKKIFNASFVKNTSNSIAVTYIVSSGKFITQLYDLGGKSLDKIEFTHNKHLRSNELSVGLFEESLRLELQGLTKKNISANFKY